VFTFLYLFALIGFHFGFAHNCLYFPVYITMRFYTFRVIYFEFIKNLTDTNFLCAVEHMNCYAIFL